MNKDDSIIEIEKFLKKLSYKIENSAKIRLFGKCIVEKILIDDILCCIDTNIPKEYKTFVERYAGIKTLQSDKYYKSLCSTVKQKFLFSSNYYMINLKQVKDYIAFTKRYFASDINYVFSDEAKMI